MNINVNNLDLGYEQCEALHSLVGSTGESLLQNLALNINNLKSHWVGSDATIHINNLITVYEAFLALITDAKAITANACEKIIAIQEVRNANGGAGNVGSPLSSAAPNAASIARCDSTSEYFVDPAARVDYTTLQEECTNYSDFISKYRSMKDELLGNWTAGANREQAVEQFNEFDSNSEIYKKYLTDARDNLGIAVSNMSQL